MMKPKARRQMDEAKAIASDGGYDAVLHDVATLIDSSRRAAARAVNTEMTRTYWLIGRRIVEHEQHGAARAGYGQEVLARLASDLVAQFGRGFSERNLRKMRAFFLAWQIRPTLSAESSGAPASAMPDLPLPWSHYVRLLAIPKIEARSFYETEALRGGWSIRQLERQIGTQFYERTALSKDKARMLTRGAESVPSDAVSPEEEVGSPYVLEFLNLRDEYSESELEAALVEKLESFLLELGGDFALPNKVLAAEYQTKLPAEDELATEVARARKLIEERVTPP